jgi:hypothetical protein
VQPAQVSRIAFGAVLVGVSVKRHPLLLSLTDPQDLLPGRLRVLRDVQLVAAGVPGGRLRELRVWNLQAVLWWVVRCFVLLCSGLLWSPLASSGLPHVLLYSTLAPLHSSFPLLPPHPPPLSSAHSTMTVSLLWLCRMQRASRAARSRALWSSATLPTARSRARATTRSAATSCAPAADARRVRVCSASSSRMHFAVSFYIGFVQQSACRERSHIAHERLRCCDDVLVVTAHVARRSLPVVLRPVTIPRREAP